MQDDLKDGPSIAGIAALLGDPARANMLTALLDGRALTVSELARTAGVALPTASGHLAKLHGAGLLESEKQGRHRYVRLSGPEVAEALEGLMSLARRTGAVRVRTGPRDEALRRSRVCYDHLAGGRAVALLQALERRGWIADVAVTEAGRVGLTSLGIDIGALERLRRPLCRRCLDWSERRNHLGGALGAAILDLIIDQRWARREEGRVLSFTAEGGEAFAAAFLV